MSSATLSISDFDPELYKTLPAHERAFVDGLLVEESRKVTLRDLKITDEEGTLVSFIANPVQRSLMKEFGLSADDPAPKIAGLKLRKRILKARRQGMSTMILALMFLDTVNNSNRRSVSVAHDSDSTKAIFEIVRRFHTNLPPHKKLEAKRSNTRELYFEAIDSRIFCATAGTDNVGSGSTLHNCHKSERSKWQGTTQDIAALDASLDEATRLGNIIEETTAYGLNFFYHDWLESMDGKGIYQPIFFPWFANDTYRSRAPYGFVRTEEEEKRSRQFKLDNEQLQWYREKKSERKELTPQEYPHTPEEAFLSSGNAFFNRDILILVRNQMEQDKDDYTLEGLTQQDFGTGFERIYDCYARGTLTIFVLPQIRAGYVIGADVAKGLTQRGDPDSSSAHVTDIATWEECAHLHGIWEEHEFGLILDELGRWYNLALIGVETVGGYGTATLDALTFSGQYPIAPMDGHSGIYCHQEHNARGQPIGNPVAGWITSVRTKPVMLSAVATGLVDGQRLHSKLTIMQLLSYVKLPNGKSGAETGAHDDCVMSLAIADAIMAQLYDRTAQMHVQMAKWEPPPPVILYGRTRRGDTRR